MDDEKKINEPVPVSERVPTGGKKDLTKPLAVLVFVAIGMFVFAFANAELFVMFCQKVGLIAPDATKLQANFDEAEFGRDIEIYWSGHAEQQLPVSISVDKSYQPTQLGKRTINDYFISNLSEEVVYIRPIHDVNPLRALDYLDLEECFCFTEQKLEPGQQASFPIVYRFRTDLPANVKSIKMNYTLFPSTKEAYERSLENPETVVDAKTHGLETEAAQ